jgi:hypothetical protein
VQQVEVDVVGGEAAEASLACRDRPEPRGVGGQHLGDEKDLVSPSSDCISDEDLGVAVGVHLGGVDDRHAEVESEAQCRDLVPLSRRVLRHVPASLSEDRDDGPTRKSCRTHSGYRHSCSP